MSCNCTEIPEIPGLSVRYIPSNQTLYVTYNGITTPVIIPTSTGEVSENVEYITIPITSNGQTYFSNVIPSDATLLKIEINGLSHYQDDDIANSSYSVVNSNITWTGPYDLKTIYTMKLMVKRNGSN